MTYDDSANSVAFSPDGKYVVSSGDTTARVWEAATGKEVARMTHDDFVRSVAFSPDGKYVVSGSYDSTVRVWEWQSSDLITNACTHMPRNLTRAEWKQYIGDALPYQAVCENLPLEAEISLTPTAMP
jgi:WD40 repeat protein